MSFKLAETLEKKFENFDDLLVHVQQEKKDTSRISIKELLRQGAAFTGDSGFGKHGYALTFNQYAMIDLCRLLELSFPMLVKLEGHELASNILNDRINSKALSDNVKKAEFVFDEPSNTVLGIVNDSYVGYSNEDFINNINMYLSGNNKQMSLLATFGDFAFETSYSINTHLHLRLINKQKTGVVQGTGGTGDDISHLGIELSNSMAGGSALKMAYFVKRLVCANGLILPVGGANSRLIHSGKRSTVNERLETKISKVIGGLNQVSKTLQQLGDVEFNPYQLARAVGLKSLFSIIPHLDLKQLTMAMLTDSGFDRTIYPKVEREHRQNEALIRLIPQLIGGKTSSAVFYSSYRTNATMFDFINVFTEEAHKCSPKDRLQIETESGELANFIVRNKKKFN